VPGPFDSQLPPDPFADDGVDDMAVEMAERLAHDGVSPTDPRWDHLGAEPTIDDFDQAESEISGFEDDRTDEWAAWTVARTRRNIAVRVIAVLLALGLVSMYVLSYFR